MAELDDENLEVALKTFISANEHHVELRLKLTGVLQP
jgi:hypothetical protein